MRFIRSQVMPPFWRRAPARAPPEPDDAAPEYPGSPAVAGHGAVPLAAPDDTGQPFPLLGDGQAAAHQLGFHLLQFGRHLLCVRDPLNPEPSPPGHPGDAPEPQERERLRLPPAPRLPQPARVRPEPDQPGLVRVRLQGDPREPAAQLPREPLRVILVPEAGSEVVREPGNDDI